ncbi:uncharacterized protein LOC142974583 [Anticarsia gemmatalis]|uniref:uncharacterized protein LOC142974583 n=1 Tax=Anticarsia gemmatalis TaxID=129554 RepID=UPI003F76FECA
MRTVSVILLVVVATMAAEDPEVPRYYNIEEAPQLFEQFIKDNERQYKDEADRQVHYDAFVDALKYINDYNAKNSGVTLGITPFTDFTDEERKQRFGTVIGQ